MSKQEDERTPSVCSAADGAVSRKGVTQAGSSWSQVGTGAPWWIMEGYDCRASLGFRNCPDIFSVGSPVCPGFV